MCRRVLVLVLLLLPAVLSVPALAQEGTVEISWPPAVYVVSGTFPVWGTVNPPNLQSYFLEAAAYETETAYWMPVSLPSSTPVVNQVLGEWLTTILPDGLYQLRLHVVLKSGEERFAIIAPIRVDNSHTQPDTGVVVLPATPAAGGGAVVSPVTAVPFTPAVTPLPQIPTFAPTAAALPTAAPPQPAQIVNELPVEVGGQVLHFQDAAKNAMHTAGMTWVKWQIPYQKGMDLSVPRDRIQWSHDAGFKALLSVRGEVTELAEMGEDYYPVFAGFLGQVAALNPDAIEVWNEQNIDREWPLGRISPRSYVEMLRQAYTAIKAANPNVMVIAGAPAPTGFFGGCGGSGCDDGPYYWGMANAGAANYADCIGVHYNEGILHPRQLGGDIRDPYPTRYFQPMTDRAADPFRASGTPVCYTELGYLSPEGYGPLPSAFWWAGNTSVQEQAEWLRDAVAIAGDDPRIRLIIVFNVDFDQYGADPQAGYAIIRPDGSCPACEAMGSLRGQ